MHVKGHSNHPWNDAADALANRGILLANIMSISNLYFGGNAVARALRDLPHVRILFVGATGQRSVAGGLLQDGTASALDSAPNPSPNLNPNRAQPSEIPAVVDVDARLQ